MKEKRKINPALIIAPVVAMVCMLTVYFLKGIYPFGEKNISYYDMSQSMVPLYYHTYDVLHGTKSLLFDWYSGAGGNMADTMGNFVLSPFNLFFLVVKREQILQSMSLFLLLKVAVAAFSMAFYSVKKYKKVTGSWHVMAGIAYASCGFIIQYYTNIHFLDLVALFPLLIWSYERLIQEKKVAWYTFFMALFCVVNIYLTGMVCIYLILYGGILLKQINKREEQREAAFRIAFFTCTALLISGIVVIPAMISLTGSVRNVVAQLYDYRSNIMQLADNFKEQKYFMLYGSEFAIAGIAGYLFTRKKECISGFGYQCFLFLLLILPVWIEGINLFWHIGGYVQFPMRFGYMLSFTGIVLGEKIVHDHIGPEDKKLEEGVLQKIMGILSLSMLPLTIMVLYTFSCSFLESGIRDLMPYHAYWLVFLLLFLNYLFVFLSGRKKQIEIVTITLIICQMTIGWYGFLAPVSDYAPECGDEIVTGSEEIRESELLKADSLNRIKDKSVSLSANYPFILQKASMSNWTWGIEENLFLEMLRLGYSQNYSRILDAGGTIFSDMLLNVKETITPKEAEPELYTAFGETENYYLNHVNYEYPIGILVSKDFWEWDKQCEETGLSYQNELFHAITGVEEDLIETGQEQIVDSKAGYDEKRRLYNYDYTIEVKEKSVLYLEMETSIWECTAISVNGEFLKVPTLQDEENEIYPAAFNNGLLECGLFENESVSLHIESVSEKALQDIKWGTLKVQVLQKSAEKLADQECTYTMEKSGMRIQKEADEDGFLYLPIGYSNNWIVYVNGEKITQAAGMKGAFLFIPVSEGKNDIEIQFRPGGFLMGIVLSVIGIVLFLAGSYIVKYKSGNSQLAKAASVCFCILWGGILLFGYLVPMVVFCFLKLFA